MVKAARAGLDKQRGLDERAGRGFVRYPARTGEPERSVRRGYDDDGSAGDAAKYGDARADDDDGGYDLREGSGRDGRGSVCVWVCGYGSGRLFKWLLIRFYSQAVE